MTKTERDPWLERLAEEEAVLMPLPYVEPSPIFMELQRLREMSWKAFMVKLLLG
jgi:hypothetical protein